MKRLLFIFIILQTSILLCQQKSIVSLTNGNYWVYDNQSSQPNGERDSYITINTSTGDTTLNNRTCRIIEQTTYNQNGKSSSRAIWYADETIFSTYNGTEFFKRYDSGITRDTTLFSDYVSTMGYVSSRINVDSGYIFDGYYKTQTLESSNSRYSSYYKYSEKYGLVYSSSYGSGYSSRSELMGAKIDNIRCGKLPPPLINNYNSSGRTLDIEFELLEEDILFDKIIIYNYSHSAYMYVPIDSIVTSDLQLSRALALGNYNLKFSYKTEEGAESSLSNNILVSIVPTAFVVFNNYPNPFNGETKIPFEIHISSAVDLVIFNILGEVVYSDKLEAGNPGYYEFNVNMKNIASGIYFYRVGTSAGNIQTNKMVLMK